MKQESLEKTLNKIISSMDTLKIPTEDKVELMINLIHFLDKDQYIENVKILQKGKKEMISYYQIIKGENK